MADTASSKARSSRTLFLASHALQSPIAAIRWGSSRLKKMMNGANTEQKDLIDGIHANSKMLSQMFDALLTLAKVEDGVHMGKLSDIYLQDFFSTAAFKDIPDLTILYSCPKDLLLRTDRLLFEAIISSLFAVVSSSYQGQRTLNVEASMEKNVCHISFRAPLQFSFLEEKESDEGDRRMVGGVAGLMLAIASSLSVAIGATFSVEQGDHGLLDLTIPIPAQS